MLKTRFLSPTDQKCADSSTYWQFLYYRPPGKFRSIGNTKNHVGTLTCLEWLLKYVNIPIILAPKLMSPACALLKDNVGNYLYLNNGRFKFEVDPHLFNLRLHHFSQFQRKKKDFQKLAGLWLAGEMVDHIGIYGSKVAEGFSAFQRLVMIYRSALLVLCQRKFPMNRMMLDLSQEEFSVRPT